VKQRRLERVERRRPLVEFNLISADASRPTSRRRRGCLPVGGAILLMVATFAALALGLH
jgi:hypothetical protein